MPTSVVMRRVYGCGCRCHLAAALRDPPGRAHYRTVQLSHPVPPTRRTFPVRALGSGAGEDTVLDAVPLPSAEPVVGPHFAGASRHGTPSGPPVRATGDPEVSGAWRGAGLSEVGASDRHRQVRPSDPFSMGLRLFEAATADAAEAETPDNWSGAPLSRLNEPSRIPICLIELSRRSSAG